MEKLSDLRAVCAGKSCLLAYRNPSSGQAIVVVVVAVVVVVVVVVVVDLSFTVLRHNIGH